MAKSEPQTINKTKENLSKGYKSTWVAFNSLEKKKLIREADIKMYSSRKFSRYWLTDEGIINAMLEGADKALLERSKKFFPDEKILHCFLE